MAVVAVAAEKLLILGCILFLKELLLRLWLVLLVLEGLPTRMELVEVKLHFLIFRPMVVLLELFIVRFLVMIMGLVLVALGVLVVVVEMLMLMFLKEAMEVLMGRTVLKATRITVQYLRLE